MKSKRSRQCILLISLWAICMMLFLTIYGVSRSAWAAQWVDGKVQENWKAHRGRGSLSGVYSGLLDRVILEDVYQPGFSEKKVYLIGSCTVEELLDVNDMSVRERQEIENLGMPGYNFIDLKYLVDWFRSDYGFGQHFNKRTLILVGAYFEDTNPPGNPAIRSSFEASGLYDYSKDGEINTRHPLEPLGLWRMMRARIVNFIARVQYVRRSGRTGGSRVRPTNICPEINDTWLPQQLVAFRQLLEDLKATHATVKVVILPAGSWLETPRRIEIRRQILEICQQEKLDVVNLAHAVKDEQFIDTGHLAIEGQQVTHSIVYPIIQQHMAEGNSPSSE